MPLVRVTGVHVHRNGRAGDVWILCHVFGILAELFRWKHFTLTIGKIKLMLYPQYFLNSALEWAVRVLRHQKY